jgi:hypothetical protein
LTKLTVESYTLPGALLGDENPLPFFRDAVTNMPVTALPSLPAGKQAYMGWETGFRVLPYRMQDQYTRKKEMISLRALVLENEFLRAVFLPELGGRLASLVYLPQGRELLHRNPVFQPANLAIRNAWFSGGIEWNIGQYGHTFHTCAPVFAAEIRSPGGDPGLRLYEFERCKRLFWQIDFYLPPGLPFLLAYTRVVNPNEAAVPMYWWTNTAVNEAPGVRVLSPAADAIYIDFTKDGFGFGSTPLPGLPSLRGADGTYSLNSPFANEFFFQCDAARVPWEAALDADGQGFIEASTARLKYRKLFCWGTHAGGRHWQEFLARPGQAYLEIQAGLAPTQVHGLPMPGRAAWDWTQAFGYLEAPAAQVHGPDWPAAAAAVEQALYRQLPAEKLEGWEAACRANAARIPERMLQAGSGWGALEQARMAAQSEQAPADLGGLPFSTEQLGPEQDIWFTLLRQGAFPARQPGELPGAWMVQAEWARLLEAALSGADRERPQDWLAWLHLGTMRCEAFDRAGAEQAWQASLHAQPSPWAWRGLAVLRVQEHRGEDALACYEKAWDLAVRLQVPPAGQRALACEYLQLLVDRQLFARGAAVYAQLPPAARDADRVQILRAQCALGVGDLAGVQEALHREYAVVREGETVLTDLWFEVQARLEAQSSGRALDADLRREMRLQCTPPAGIDFRSFNG